MHEFTLEMLLTRNQTKEKVVIIISQIASPWFRQSDKTTSLLNTSKQQKTGDRYMFLYLFFKSTLLTSIDVVSKDWAKYNEAKQKDKANRFSLKLNNKQTQKANKVTWWNLNTFREPNIASAGNSEHRSHQSRSSRRVIRQHRFQAETRFNWTPFNTQKQESVLYTIKSFDFFCAFC